MPIVPDARDSTDAGVAISTVADASSEIDAADSAPAMAIETVQVPASGAPVTLKTSLAMGELYLLKAWGSIDLGAQNVDAEFTYDDQGAATDEAGGVDPGVDIGVPQVHPGVHFTPSVPGPGRMKWFGEFRHDHVYFTTVTGQGTPLTLKLTKPAGADAGTGSIAVSVVPLSPAPPKLAPEIETVKVPVRKVVVMTTMPTVADNLYLLQASGSGKVGGGGLGLGDAEYMDWSTTGANQNEGESGADFGIGVDEIDVGAGPQGPGGYKPRARWWGAWRMDHTYYMLFRGTGKVIQFLYFDSGYGDNSADTLSVKVFNAP